jgi:hypothetical protein
VLLVRLQTGFIVLGYASTLIHQTDFGIVYVFSGKLSVLLVLSLFDLAKRD